MVTKKLILPKGRWYQNVIIAGEDAEPANLKRKYSNFWNEGKWNNFIKPLLPKDASDMTFIELGCNIGLYPKMAKEYGFKNVIGVEKGASNCKMAEIYRKDNKLDYKILNKTVGEDFNINEVPLADIVLMSNMHYYIPIEQLVKFLDSLLTRTAYCLIVSRHINNIIPYIPSGDFDAIKILFKDWGKVDARVTTKGLIKNDPHPRDLWSSLFKGKLERLNIDDYLQGHYFSFSLRDLVRRVYKRHRIEIEKMRYYHKWVERSKLEGRTKEEVVALVKEKIKMIESLRDEGQREPIVINLAGKVLDGMTRLTVMKEFGYKTALFRRV